VAACASTCWKSRRGYLVIAPAAFNWWAGDDARELQHRDKTATRSWRRLT
jgi:hypothetical protein